MDQPCVAALTTTVPAVNCTAHTCVAPVSPNTMTTAINIGSSTIVTPIINNGSITTANPNKFKCNQFHQLLLSLVLQFNQSNCSYVHCTNNNYNFISNTYTITITINAGIITVTISTRELGELDEITSNKGACARIRPVAVSHTRLISIAMPPTIAISIPATTNTAETIVTIPIVANPPAVVLPENTPPTVARAASKSIIIVTQLLILINYFNYN